MDDRQIRRGLAPWFSDDDRPAVADFWSIFERTSTLKTHHSLIDA
jgi:hypothetical protein